tara:strand:- start:2608 stop:2829 length:222 start_codon:yes stop_codon:yes gene_type:complete
MIAGRFSTISSSTAFLSAITILVNFKSEFQVNVEWLAKNCCRKFIKIYFMSKLIFPVVGEPMSPAFLAIIIYP